MTIDKMRATTIKQLMRVHDLGGYRNAAKIVKQLKPYIHEHRENEKIIYLNKHGRELIGSSHEVKHSPYIQHILLTNEVYIYFKCPFDWRTECPFEREEKLPKGFTLTLGNTALKSKKRVIADAVFTRNGYVYLVEIDNIRKMQDNQKKIETYTDLWSSIKMEFGQQPILYFFTNTINRKKKFEDWLANKRIRYEVRTFDEIR